MARRPEPGSLGGAMSQGAPHAEHGGVTTTAALATLPHPGDDRQARFERISRRFEIPMLVAALLVIPALVIEQSATGDAWGNAATVLNWVIWGAFALELAVMLAIVPDRRRWLRTHPLEVALVVLTPPFLPAALQGARVLRLLRVLRLARALQLARRCFSLDGLRYVSALAVFTILGGGAAFASVEKTSTADGLWWAITTATTVGYGDISPHTDTGRLIAVAVMVVGIGFVAILTGAIAQRFLTPSIQANAEAIEGTEEEILAEITEVSQRLAALEAKVRLRASASGP
jgi:voltage-gated potassium channel